MAEDVSKFLGDDGTQGWGCFSFFSGQGNTQDSGSQYLVPIKLDPQTFECVRMLLLV